METIRKHIGEGFGKGELYAALAYDSGDAFGGMAIKAIRLNPPSGSTAITIGDSTTAITLATYAQRAISIYTTCASADGSNNVLPVYIDATMSGTGGVGRALEAKLTVSGKLGGWGNALKGYLDVTATNGCAGLISGICAEMRLPSASIQTGTYAVLELNWVGQTNTATLGALTGSHTTLIYANVGGGTATDFDSNGYIFEIEGLSDSDGNAWYDNTLRIAIGDTAWYVPLSSAQGSFTTAYPIISTSYQTIGITLTSSRISALAITTTSADATGGSTIIKPLYVDATMSGSGGLGRAIEGKLTVSGKLGDYGNAIKGYTDLTGGTGCVGLVSAVCAEMKMPAATALGTHGVLEIELVTPTSAVIQQGIGANCTSFIWARVSGNVTAVQSFNDYGYFLNLQGLTSSSTDLFDGNTLKCVIGSTKYYLLMSTATASFTTAYPIVSTYSGGENISITSTDTAGNQEEINVISTVTSTGAVAHKAILSTCTYNPSSAGGSVPIAIAGMTVLNTNKTHNALYMWGVQGGIKFLTGSEVASSQIAAGRFVLEEAGTVTYTSGNIAGIYVDNLITSPMASESGGQIDLVRIANHGGLMDNAINVYGPNITNLLYLGGCTVVGCVGADIGATAIHKTICRSIKIDIDGTTYYLLASTVVAAS